MDDLTAYVSVGGTTLVGLAGAAWGAWVKLKTRKIDYDQHVLDSVLQRLDKSEAKHEAHRAELDRVRAETEDCHEKHAQALEREQKSEVRERARARAMANMVEQISRLRRELGHRMDDTGQHQLDEIRASLTHATPPDAYPALGATVLVVDDDAQVRRALQHVLEASGYHCLAVDSVREAQRTLALHHVHGIIVDVLMPGRSGVELVHALRQSNPALPVVLISGDHDLLEQIAAAEGIEAVRKPFESEEVIAALVRASIAMRHR